MSRFSEKYIDNIFSNLDDYQALVELQSILLSWSSYDLDKPDYGLSPVAFVFTEALTWFAQASRSGVWTYFEATPIDRQQKLLSALTLLAPTGYNEAYESGMAYWQDEVRMKELDIWMREIDSKATAWLGELLRQNQQEIKLLYI